MRRARVQLCVHGLVSIVLTWPLAAHLTDSIPRGTEPAATVPLLNLWTLRWNQQQLGSGFSSYWDAPIFHPTSGAFALSEPQPLTALLFAPIAWISGNPTLAYNLTLLCIVTLNGFAAARLAKRFGVSAGPALLAGVLAQALPFVATQFGVLQLTVVFPVLFLVDAVLAWAPAGGRGRAAAVGAWLAATFLTCGYYGLFASVVIGVAALTLVRRRWFSWSRLADLGIAAALFAVVTAPVLIAQARYTSSYSRPSDLVLALSAEPIDFIRLHPDQAGASVMPWLQDEGGSLHYLYPGTALLFLAIAGFAVAFARVARKPDVDDTREDEEREVEDGEDEERGADERDAVIDARRRVLFGLHAAALAFVVSLGLRVSIGGFAPYDVLRLHVPGFDNLRSPFRAAALVQVLLLPFAAVALDGLWRRWPVSIGRASRLNVGAALACVIVLAGAVEVAPLSGHLVVVPDPGGDWVTWLRDEPQAQPQPDDTGDGAVAMVPFPESGAASSYEATTEAMLSGLEHGRPLVNGYSGLFPESYDELAASMRGFPSVSSVAHLRAIPVTYVVVARSWLTPEAQGWMRDWSRELTPVFEGVDHVIYRVNPE